MTMPKGWKPSTNSSYRPNKSRINISNYKNSDKIKEIKKALIIGVSEYDNLPQLDLCKNDAQEMYKVLQSQEYVIGEYQKLVGYVTFNNLWDIIHDFFQDLSTKSKDTLFFYFSGHGITDSYENYLASSEIEEKRPSRRGLAFDKLTSLTQRCNSRRIIAVLDCCFSGSIQAEGFKSGSTGRIGDDDTTIAKKARETMENRIKESEGLCFLASSLSYQQSLIKKNLGHSLYTYYLLEGLKGQQGYVDDNGYVTADHLSRYVYDKLIDESKDLQKPIKKSNISGDLIVAYYPNLVKEIEEQPKIDDDAAKHSTFDLIQKYIDEGKEYRYLGSYSEAIDSFDKALKINPNNFYACKIKGDILLYDLGRSEEAITYYNRILDKESNAIQVLKDKAVALENLLLYEDATKYYDKVLKVYPNDEDTKKKRNRVLEKHKEQRFSLIIKEIKSNYVNKEFSKVIDLCNTAIDIEPKNIISYLYKGLSLAILKRNDEASLYLLIKF